MRLFALTFAFAFAWVGCAPRAKPAVTAATADGGWHTLRAEHRVSIDVALPDGKHDHRTIRGVIAVEKPDRFRLRALGPAGISLFDIVSVGGRVKVIEAIKDPRASSLGEIIESMAGDLQAAFLLAPAPPERKVTIEKDTVVVRDDQRTVRLSAFHAVNGRSLPARLEIDHPARHYKVVVEASHDEVDSTLDPDLFKE